MTGANFSYLRSSYFSRLATLGLVVGAAATLGAGCGSEKGKILSGGSSTEGLKDAPSDSPAVVNGQLSVCGNQLCNEHGASIQLRGMSTHGLQWYPDCAGPAPLRGLAEEWGADVVRFAMYVSQLDLGYLKAPITWQSDMNRYVENASTLGMYAIIDWHILNEKDPNTELEAATSFFDKMSKAHGERTNVFYEIVNEPNGDVTWADIKRYADEIIPVIRANDPDGIILVGTPHWSSLSLSGSGSASEIIDDPIDDENVMYTFHFYAGSHQSYLEPVTELADSLPLFVSEWGTQTHSGDGENDFEASAAFLDMFEEKRISWVNWNYSDDARSGAVFVPGVCGAGGPWTGETALKEAGSWILNRIQEPADDFPLEPREESLSGGGAGGGAGN